MPAGCPAAPRAPLRSRSRDWAHRGRCGSARGARPSPARMTSLAVESSFDLDLRDPTAKPAGLVAVRRELGQPQGHPLRLDRLVRLEAHLPVTCELTAGQGLAQGVVLADGPQLQGADRKSTRLNSSHVAISYAVFCLKKKNKTR